MPIISKKCFTKEMIEIDGPLIIEPKVFEDKRGFFFESWNKKDLDSIVLKNNKQPPVFVQDNHSKSAKGILRGLHIQQEPFSQGKLIRCISGKIFDVAIDMRLDSATFCKWTSVILSEENKSIFWIPKGFAHGFLSLQDNSQILYKATNYWDKESELTLKWDDPLLSIDWPIKDLSSDVLLSEKDKKGALISNLDFEKFSL